MSVFNTPGMYLRTPGGNVEDVAAMKAAGFKWIALNVGDHVLADWEVVIERSRSANMEVLPWMYLRTPADVERLCGAARIPGFGNRVILNCESELRDGRYTIEHCIEEAKGLDACICTEPVPFHGIPWYKAAHMMLHCGLFPQESQGPYDPRWFRAQWFAYGMNRVAFMQGNHGLTPTAFPVRQNPFSIYTADDSKDMGQTYATWSPAELPSHPGVPYTGPYYHNQFSKRPQAGKTVVALKIAMHNAGFGHFYKPDAAYNQALKKAMVHFQRWAGLVQTGNYGQGSYQALLRLASAIPGQVYALNNQAIALINEDQG